MASLLVLVVLESLLLPAAASLPPQPNAITGTSFLDHNAPISGFWGQTFLKQNIPYIDIPEATIQNVYYYRWSSIQRHLRYTVPGSGYILTEFMQPVGYAQAFNTIDAAAGHQIDEASWLASTFYDDDYIQIYTRGPGNTIQYTHWILDAMYRRSLLVGNSKFVTNQLQDMIRLWDEWDYTFDKNAGLYYFTPLWDAQEYSLPGYVAAAAAGGNDTLQINGPNTFRPSVNAYMVANARAIANVATAAGNSGVASNFTNIANTLQTAMYNHLWDPKQQFFVDVIQPNNPSLTPVIGREEVGIYPFRFGIGLDSTHMNPTATALFDTSGFLAQFGPPTLEIRNQYYAATKPSGYCCFWNGQSWPFSTAHVIKSLAAIYRSGNSPISANQYIQYLNIYANTQHKNGVPYVAESHYPAMDAWSADSSNHSEHYDHSTYNDDVISGLLGIIPRADNNIQISPIVPSNWTYFALENLSYHGHLVTVLYDKDGSRYKQGSGLTVFVDGQHTYNGQGISALVPIPAPVASTSTVPINIAANANGLGSYPKASATFTYSADNPYKAIDGYLFYDAIPDNRWTNYQSTTANDTLTITFARPRTISSVTLALYSDVTRNGAVDVPASIVISGSGGVLGTFTNTSSFLPNDRNTFQFAQVTTTFVSINLFKKPNVWVGICEAEVWTPPVTGPAYYAVDAQLTSASVTTGTSSTATANGAVVNGLSSGSVVAFSGINSSNGGRIAATLSFANSASNSISIGYSVNQVPQGTISLGATGGRYTTTQLTLPLSAGKNFVSFTGGAAGLSLEVLTIPTS